MVLNGLHFKLFGTGRILSAGVEAGAFVNPTDRDADPTIQAFCVPIVYLDRDTLGLVEDTYGLTITTVVVKPKSRGSVRLRSADPNDMPLVSPNLLKDPEDAKAMLDGQRFFLRAFETKPLADRIERVAIPDPADRSDEALLKHCRRFVKTNYHPSGTCRMGPPGDPMAVLDSRLRVRGDRGAAGVRPVGDAEHQRGEHDGAGADAGEPVRGVRARAASVVREEREGCGWRGRGAGGRA